MSLIIGASDAPEEKHPNALSEPEVDLPHPASAPEARRVLTAEDLSRLARHDNALIRTFAIEQIAHRDDPELLDLLVERVKDDDERVAVEAVAVLSEKDHAPAIDAIVERFAGSTGEIAATCATTLGHLAPERLLDAVGQRRRLDDIAYGAVATAVGISGRPETIEFLSKALNRAGALGPERKAALYGAALLSGSVDLAGRVIGVALTDSSEAEPDESMFPARAALASIAGLPPQYSQQQAGLEVFDHAREVLEQEVLPELEGEDRARLEAAMKAKKIGDTLAALDPVLHFPVPEALSEAEAKDLESLGTIPARRKGLLEALVKRSEVLGRLDPKPGAIFVAAAAQAALIIISNDRPEATSPAIQALAKTLEGGPDAAALADLDEDGLVALFEARGDREMRRVTTTAVREHFRRATTLRRFFRAIIRAGHGEALVHAAAEVDEAIVHSALARAAEECVAPAEEVVVELLQSRETDDKTTDLVLHLAERLRTERVALTLGRRFFALREVNRSLLARAVLRTGDARLVPLLESRAFPDEAEEVAWAILALVHDRPVEGELEKALERTMADRVAPEEDETLRLPLKCAACGETNGYAFERVYIDVEAKDSYGDPAFVGEVKCKACGAEERLEPTESAARIITGYMMELLQAAQRGVMPPNPPVAPAQTEVGGKRMGLAEALRTLDAEIRTAPDNIRLRLHRARVKLLLKRGGIRDDLSAVYAQDPGSPEARAFEATLLMNEGKDAEAMDKCAEAVRALDAEEPPRLYDADGPERLKDTLEQYMVEIELSGGTPPEDIDLTAARQRREERDAALLAQRQAQLEALERARGGHDHDHHDHDHQHDHDHEAAAPSGAVPKVGRNEPCPCGSGKKYKKCHGARA